MEKLLKKKIAIAESDEFFKNILSTNLEKDGADVLPVYNFQDLEKITFNQRPDLIITDVHIGGQELISFMKDLRLDKWGSLVKIFILSEQRLEEDEYFIRELAIIKPAYLFDKKTDEVEDILEKIFEVVS